MRQKHNKYNTTFKANDIFNEWRKESNNKDITQTEHSGVVKDFVIELSKLLVYKHFQFRMPYRLGYIYVTKYKRTPKLNSDGSFKKNSLPIDFGATRKFWRELYPDKTMEEIYKIPNKKVIYNFNDHTDGYVMRFYWDKLTTQVKNYRLYSFKAGLILKDTLKEALRNPDLNLDYYERRKH